VNGLKEAVILFVSGPFNLLDEHKEVLQDFADNGLLGVSKVEGPLDIFSVLTNFKFNGAFEQMQELVAIDDAIVCESKGAEVSGSGIINWSKSSREQQIVEVVDRLSGLF